jgi:nucleotide-binding universal stress UspA family protein
MNDAAAPAPITVAVAGEERAALAYALSEARRTGSPVRLVHVIEPVPMPAMPVGPMVGFHDFERAGAQLLDRAVEELRSLDADVSVESSLRRGPVAPVLVAESRNSRLLVLQHRALSRLARVFTGSTSTAVAARARCPVVSVPENWRTGDRQTVVVGVDPDGEPAHALAAAFVEAENRDAALLVLHAWRLAIQYAALGGPTDVEQEWRQRSQLAVEQAVTRAGDGHPQVKTTIELPYVEPADAIERASEEADLLILGRRTRRGPLRIGSVARALIRVSKCPVMVVPLPDLPEPDIEDWQMQADEVSPQS